MLAAVLVFAPIDLVVTLATGMATKFAEQSDVLSVLLWTSGTALGVAGTTLSLIFFAGVMDRIVAVDQQGEEDIPIGEILRGLPTMRLILASALAAALTVIGLAAVPDPGLRAHDPLRRRRPRDRHRGTRRLGRPQALGKPHLTARASW